MRWRNLIFSMFYHGRNRHTVAGFFCEILFKKIKIPEVTKAAILSIKTPTEAA
jgi:hypothetical protein